MIIIVSVCESQCADCFRFVLFLPETINRLSGHYISCLTETDNSSLVDLHSDSCNMVKCYG